MTKDCTGLTVNVAMNYGSREEITNATKKIAAMVKEGKIDEMRDRFSDLAVVCYINSTADLKCQSDICVTSSNAVKIVRALPNKNIFFIPDRNLGRFVAAEVPEKNIILNDGCCPIHAAVTAASVKALKAQYKDALVLCHPECEPEVVSLADFSGSTAEIIDFAKESNNKEFIVCTEEGVAFKLRSDNPDKKFYFPSPCPVCKDMKFNTVENVLRVLETEENQVEVDFDKRMGSLLPLERMLELNYIKSPDIKRHASIIDEVIKYVNRHYQENITLEEICKIFSRSRL